MDDHVDRVLATWTERRPDWDVTGMAVLGRVARLERLAERRRGEVLRPLGLSDNDIDVLAALWRHPEGLRPRDLRATMMIGTGTLTPILDRLQGRGLLQRTPDPDDRRGRVLTLTDEGRGLVEDAVPALLAVENEMLDILDGATRHQLEAVLRTLLRANEPAD